MKIKVTKKQVMSQNHYVINVRNCGLQRLLTFVAPAYYTAGVYGHNADVYQINAAVVIVTGSRPFGNIKPKDELLEKYEKQACMILADGQKTYNEKKELLYGLLLRFVQEVVASYN